MRSNGFTCRKANFTSALPKLHLCKAQTSLRLRRNFTCAKHKLHFVFGETSLVQSTNFTSFWQYIERSEGNVSRQRTPHPSCFAIHLSLRLMFAARGNININYAFCTTTQYYLLARQYTASGMHVRGLTVHRTVIQYPHAASLLAAARAPSGENNALCCFLTPSGRFATQKAL